MYTRTNRLRNKSGHENNLKNPFQYQILIMCNFFNKIKFETLQLTGRKVIIKPVYVIKANKIPRENSSSNSIIYYKDTSCLL